MVYKLSQTLTGHSLDVRSIASPSSNLILSASRDTKALAWTRGDESSAFTPSIPFHAGERFVNAVTYLPPNVEGPNGYIVAGGQDAIINIFPIGSQHADPSHMLIGHSENVCALNATVSGTIISGSWDKTARVWKNFEPTYELKGHTQAVWAVIAIDDDQFLTGAADKEIRSWSRHKTTRTFKGHTDVVRGLAVIPDIGFASCSNDGEIRVWTFEGDTIHTLSGHTSFVYSLSLLPSGDLVSGGEDRSVRVWKDGECTQVIVLPAISVWAVSTMPNGDIVAGTSDGVIRVFSEEEKRWTDLQALKEYDDSVSQQALPSQQIGDVKRSDLPGPEALQQPGNKEGQVIMIRGNGGVVEAHQWSSGAWQKIGEVVDAVGSGRRQLYNGKEYDYVFDVDIQEGVPPLKLPYNISENPYVAAQGFLQRNDLPLSYIDQVVKFIEKNTSGVQLGAPSGESIDPYTGAARYRTSTAPAPSIPGGYEDPFTGAARYRPAPASTPGGIAPNAGNISDPFTGASAYHTAQAAAPTTVSQPVLNPFLPVTAPLTFQQANIPAMRAKLNELEQKLPDDSGLRFTSEQKVALERLFDRVTSASQGVKGIKPTEVSSADVQLVLDFAAVWPDSFRFPVLDLLRVVSAYFPRSVISAHAGAPFTQKLSEISGWKLEPWPTPLPKHLETNILLSLRAVANLFQSSGSSTITIKNEAWINGLFENLLKLSLVPLVKSQWAALATIALNYSTVALEAVDEPIRRLHLQLIFKILTTAEDNEAQYRAIVALGNVTYASKTTEPLDPTLLQEIKSLSAQVAKKVAEGRFQVVNGEIEKIVG